MPSGRITGRATPTPAPQATMAPSWSRVSDDDGGESPEYEKTITVNNVPPSVNAPENANQSSNEGEEKLFDLGSFTDPGADGPWNVSVNWGDGSNTQFPQDDLGSLGQKTHTYDDNGTYTVEVTVSEPGD